MIQSLSKAINYLLGKAILKNSKVALAPTLEYLDRPRAIDTRYFDYIRLSTLELLCYEINSNQVPGNVAELGVFKGKFARYLNQHFPDRSLYLFDTFEGFDNRDIGTEKENGYSTGDQDFHNTSVAQVLGRMPYRDRCIVKKGYFPESAGDVDDVFAMVSLDTDLYEPIYNGLCFFYPRLSKGGYILIHDFNNDLYKGVRDAVQKFCRENNIGYVPIADKAGTVIISK